MTLVKSLGKRLEEVKDVETKLEISREMSWTKTCRPRQQSRSFPSPNFRPSRKHSSPHHINSTLTPHAYTDISPINTDYIKTLL